MKSPFSGTLNLLGEDEELQALQLVLSSWPLMHFVFGEKYYYPCLGSEERKTTSPITNLPTDTGYSVDLEKPGDEGFSAFHPNLFNPIVLKAIWLPLEKGDLYSYLHNLQDCPLIRTNPHGNKEILFLIHPRSFEFYKDLLNQHKDEIFELKALSLSSFRTVLVALKTGEDKYRPILVKLSLDATVSGTNRLLSKRECALSIANTSILQKRIAKLTNSAITIMQDSLSFVPEGYEFGMIYREMPDFLDPAKQMQTEYAIPLLSLLGVKNKDFLQFLVRQSGLTITQFLIEKILQPFADVFVELLFKQNVSLQGHGQNLLLKLNQNHEVIGIMYRDMGGVNLVPKEEDLLSLPENLQDLSIYYSENHVKDAAVGLEDNTIRRLLFYLTKQVIRLDANLIDEDIDLGQWLIKMQEKGCLGNWIDGTNVLSDAHAPFMPEDKFVRYGYVENLFFDAIKKALLNQKVIKEEDALKLDEQFNQYQQLEGVDYVANPCTYTLFFETLIRNFYHPYIVDKLDHLKLNIFTDNFDEQMDFWQKQVRGLCGGKKVTVNNKTYNLPHTIAYIVENLLQYSKQQITLEQINKAIQDGVQKRAKEKQQHASSKYKIISWFYNRKSIFFREKVTQEVINLINHGDFNIDKINKQNLPSLKNKRN